jgi:hypothetical protein
MIISKVKLKEFTCYTGLQVELPFKDLWLLRIYTAKKVKLSLCLTN